MESEEFDKGFTKRKVSDSDNDENNVQPKIRSQLHPDYARRSINLFHPVLSNQYLHSRSQTIHKYNIYQKEALVQRLELDETLEGHTGCVNTVQWNENGQLLVSGSDDTRVCIWDYEKQSLRGRIDTGHTANIFCAKFMPSTDSTSLISCAGDNLIKHFDLQYEKEISAKNGRTFSLHSGRVKKLSTEPLNPHVFLSASEDGTVRSWDLRMRDGGDSVLVELRDRNNITDVYSIAVNQIHPHYFVTGGCDPIVRMFDRRYVDPTASQQSCVRRFAPSHFGDASSIASHRGHITGVAYNWNGQEVLASYSGDNIYLFDVNNSKQTERLDFPPRRRTPKVRDEKGKESAEDEAAKGLRALGNGEYRKAVRCFTRAIIGNSEQASYYLHRSAAYLRLNYFQLALNDCDEAIELDPVSYKGYYRRAKALNGLGRNEEALASARKAEELLDQDQDVNMTEELYELLHDLDAAIESPQEQVRLTEEDADSDEELDPAYTSEEDNSKEEEEENEEEEDKEDLSYAKKYSGHCNIRTVKEVNFFGGRSEYVISGSDDGNIFIWNKKSAKLVQILHGDNYVVNCVQGHPYDCTLASSGIENNVKLWKPTGETFASFEDMEGILERNRKRLADQSRSQLVPLSLLRSLVRAMNGPEDSDEDEGPDCHVQ